MHLKSPLYGSLAPDSDISSQDNGSPEEDGKSPPLDPQNGCRSPGGHSTHILRIHAISSIASLMCFTHCGQAVLAAQGRAPLSMKMKRKEIADKLSFCHNKHSDTDWVNFNINACFKQGRIQVHHGEQEEQREVFFFGSEEETWPHKELHGEHASPRCLCPHTLKAGHHLLTTIQRPLQQETARPSA